MRDSEYFKKALSGKKVPILVLDQKWHRLFAVHGKPEEVKDTEEELDSLLARQGKLNQDLKDLKKVKSNLMGGIVANMEGKDEEKGDSHLEKKIEENKRLLDDVTEKMEACEDELLELPKLIKESNERLMLSSMEFCYEKLRSNAEKVAEIDAWIKQVRIDLKKNIIRKQNREINSKEMYAYMHDILGPQIIDVFDLQQEEHADEENSKDEKSKK